MTQIPMIGKNCCGAYVLRNSLGEPSLLGLESDAVRKLQNYPLQLTTEGFGFGQMWCNALKKEDTVYKLLEKNRKIMIQGD